MEKIKQTAKYNHAINLADIMSKRFNQSYSVYRQMHYPFQYVVRPQYFDPLYNSKLVYVSVHHVM